MPRGGAIFDPARCGKVVAKCTQTSTNAPAIAYLLESSIAGVDTTTSITIARTGAGVYTFTLTGAWTANKTVVKATVTSATGRVCFPVYTSADVFTLNFSDLATPSAADSGAFDLEINVYA